jgi:hypothetical protein
MIDGARVRSGGIRTPNGTVGFDATGATTIMIPANATTPAAAKAAVRVTAAPVRAGKRSRPGRPRSAS